MDNNSADSPLKLVYFDTRGRVETARLMLEMAGVPYEFTPVAVETWRSPAGKPSFLGCTPFGQLPVLYDGSFVLCQSVAIYRYLAQKLGFYGSTLQENARVDEVTEIAGDLLLEIGTFMWDPRVNDRRDEHRATLHKKLGQLQEFFTRISPAAEHWVLPGTYTLGDIRMACALELVPPLHPGLLDEFPKLQHFLQTFFAADGVRQYVRSDRRSRTYTVALAPFGGRPEQCQQWTD